MKQTQYKCLYCGKEEYTHQAKTLYCVKHKSNKYSVIFGEDMVYTPDYTKPVKKEKFVS